MSRESAPRLLIIVGCVVILVANAVIFGGRLFSWGGDASGSLLAQIYGRVAWLRTMIRVADNQGDLMARVVELEEENGRFRGDTAQLEEALREVSFYRDAAGIVSRPAGTLLKAGVFTYNAAGGVRQVTVNRGIHDGVAVGQVVMTVKGELLGVVQSVFPDHAVVWCIQDRSFQVTARVSDSEVTGLVRSDGTGSLQLDLVQKDEHIGEHSQVVTSGDDSFPAGLIIGTVRSVDNNAATLFQIVHVDPAVSADVRGPILIVRP